MPPLTIKPAAIGIADTMNPTGKDLGSSWPPFAVAFVVAGPEAGRGGEGIGDERALAPHTRLGPDA